MAHLQDPNMAVPWRAIVKDTIRDLRTLEKVIIDGLDESAAWIEAECVPDAPADGHAALIAARDDLRRIASDLRARLGGSL